MPAGRQFAYECRGSGQPDGRIAMALKHSTRPGALVISLDVELHWGMRDHLDRSDPAFAQLSSSRRVVSDLASLFANRGIRATSATVRFLFASTGTEPSAYLPVARPSSMRTA